MTTAKIFSKYKSSIKSNLSIVKRANIGVNSVIFTELVEISGINRTFLAEEVFDISLKTMLRYQKEKKKLNPRNSETALKLLSLFNKGIEVFGNMDSFMTWLNKQAYGLGDRIPLNLMSTNTGIDLIEEELIRIEFGALA